MAPTVKEFGLTEIYSSPERPPLVDVVFVHGLNGHPQKTWTSKNGVFWPADLLPQFLDDLRVRVLTYGYNANVTAFTDGASKDHIIHHAETLASDLYANRSLRRCLERPIIFVCHSLGGLVVKRCMIHCRSVENERIRHLRSIYVSTYGILFMGTPHNGSDLAKWGLLLQKICSAVLPRKFLDSSPQLVQALATRNETLLNINRLFNDTFSRFHVYFFHETKPLDLKGTREIIVDESSAAPDIEGAERRGIEADHSSMVKFDDENSPGFEAVAEAIVRYSRDAPSTIAGRWAEEKKLADIQRRVKAQELMGTVDDGDSVEDAPVAHGDRMGNSVPLLPAPSQNGSNGASNLLTRSVESLPTYRRPMFVVPPGFHPNAIFVGMEKEMTELHDRAFKVKKRADRVAAVLICGVPGSGKSHLAREYVHRYRREFPGGIFWIDAKSKETMDKCYLEVAQAAALTAGLEPNDYAWNDSEALVDEVRRWFENREEWLLVYDGLSFDDDREITYFKRYLPFSKRSSIIYTSVDRTLARKQRLFEPYCLTVRQLKVDEGRQLLFKTLGIKKPTAEQIKKATEIVEHYQGLPLAIHAISRRLSATGRPLEKYRVSSHIDQRLAEPFLEIMRDLHDRQHFAALNMINLLAFFGHHVPVGMIAWGRSALEAFQVDVMTSSRPGEHGDMDTTLGILIQYGLIERVSDPYPTDSESTVSFNGSSPKPNGENGAVESFGSIAGDSQKSSIVYQSTVDMIKIHSVVQGFCRDELKIMDRETKTTRHPQDASFYTSWLVVATSVLCKSWEIARCKMDQYSGPSAFAKDIREYETHAQRIMTHFKKADLQPPVVREARKLLRQAIMNIKDEIAKLSPSTSHENGVYGRSIFDRTSSSSSGPSSSFEDNEHLRSPTSEDDEDKTQSIDSPLETTVTEQRNHMRLGLFPPHIFRPGTESRDDTTDSEQRGTPSYQPSPNPSHVSQATETPVIGAQDDGVETDGSSGWTPVEHKKKKIKSWSQPPERSPQKPSPERRKRGRFDRLRIPFRRASALTRLSSVSGEGSISSPSDKGDKSSKSSVKDARTSLAQFVQSPPPRESQTKADQENRPTWAAIAAKLPIRTQTSSTTSSVTNQVRPSSLPVEFAQEQRTPDTRSSQSSSGAQLSLSVEVPTQQMNLGSRSDPALGPEHPSAPEHVQSAPGSRSHSRHGTSIPVRVQGTGSLHDTAPRPATTRRRNLLGIPQQVNSSLLLPGPQPIQDSAAAGHPSAIMPGTSPPPGYSSEPLPTPMSRDTSRQSAESAFTEPMHATSQPVPIPMPGYQSAYGYAGPPPERRRHRRTNSSGSGQDPAQQWIHFGGHEVDIDQARQRVEDWTQRQERPPWEMYYPQHLQQQPSRPPTPRHSPQPTMMRPSQPLRPPTVSATVMMPEPDEFVAEYPHNLVVARQQTRPRPRSRAGSAPSQPGNLQFDDDEGRLGLGIEPPYPV